MRAGGFSRQQAEFLKAEVEAAGTTVALVVKTAAYSAVSGDVVLANATGGAFAVTLPVPAAGVKVSVKKTDASANAVTVSPHASETIDGASSVVISTQYESDDFLSDGTNWWRV